MKKKKETRGGIREGSGQKKKYGEETTTIAFRVPESKTDEIKSIVNKKLKAYKTKAKAFSLDA